MGLFAFNLKQNISGSKKLFINLFYLYIGVDDVGLGEEPGSSGRNDPRAEDDFQYEVLSTEKIVEHMVDCIKEVSIYFK